MGLQPLSPPSRCFQRPRRYSSEKSAILRILQSSYFRCRQALPLKKTKSLCDLAPSRRLCLSSTIYISFTPNAPNSHQPSTMLPRLFYSLALILTSLLFSAHAAAHPLGPDPRHLAPRVGDQTKVSKRAPGVIPADQPDVQQLPGVKSFDERLTSEFEDLDRRTKRSSTAVWVKEQTSETRGRKSWKYE